MPIVLNSFRENPLTNGEALCAKQLGLTVGGNCNPNGHTNSANRLKPAKIGGFRASRTLLFTGYCTSTWKSLRAGKSTQKPSRDRATMKISGDCCATLSVSRMT